MLEEIEKTIQQWLTEMQKEGKLIVLPSLNRWDVFNLTESVDYSNSEYYEDKIEELEQVVDQCRTKMKITFFLLFVVLLLVGIKGL